MKILYQLAFIIMMSSCGIDKDPTSVTLPSVDNSGELDISFNGNGILTIHNSASGNSDDFIYDIAIDSQNRLIAVGESVNGSGNSDLAVWRLTSSGSLDSSFSGDGVFIHDNAAGGNSHDIGYGVTIGPSDEIFVTGSSRNGSGNSDMTVWKIDSSGSLDSSFNGSGVFTHHNAAGGGLNDVGYDIKLDSNGKVVVVGASDQTGTNRDMAVWRLNSSGSLDTSFDSDGFNTDDGSLGGEDDRGNSLAIDSANNIIIAGQADSVAQASDMIVWKFTSSGALDVSFNGSGFFSQNGAAGGSGYDEAQDIVMDSSGNFYVTGFSLNAQGDNDMVVWKISSSGTLDSSFNSTGFQTFDISQIIGGSFDDSGQSINIDSQGRIVVSGFSNGDMAVWRYLTSGSLDADFNIDGAFFHDSAASGFGSDSAQGVAEDSLGHLYLGGFSENNSGDKDAAFWRMK